jgi:hypothetical protein
LLRQTATVLAGTASIYSSYVAYKQDKNVYTSVTKKVTDMQEHVKSLESTISEKSFENILLKSKLVSFKDSLTKFNLKSSQDMDRLTQLREDIENKNKELDLQTDGEMLRIITEEIASLRREETLRLQSLESVIQSAHSEIKSIHIDTMDSNTQNTDNELNTATGLDPKQIQESSFGSYINNISEYIESLNIVEKIALSLLLFNYVIFSALISIVFIFYGDYLINKFHIEKRFPNLAYFIKLRRKFQSYYLLLCICWIFFILLIEILFSIGILFGI